MENNLLINHFVVISGKTKNIKLLKTNKHWKTNTIPLFSAKKSAPGNENMGLYGYVDINTINPKEILTKNSITVNRNGSVGKVYYRNSDYILSSDCSSIIPIKQNEWTQWKLIALCTYLEIVFQSKSYGNKITKENIESIDLTDFFSFNFEFKNLLQEKLKFKEHIKSKSFYLKNVDDFETSNSNKIKISSLFQIKSAKTLNKNQINLDNTSQHKNVDFPIPYVTRKEFNNGILFYLNDCGYDLIKNKKINSYLNICSMGITIGDETQKAYLQKNSFFSGDKIKILTPVFEFSECELLYICSAIEQSTIELSWGNALNLEKLNKLEIFISDKKLYSKICKYLNL